MPRKKKTSATPAAAAGDLATLKIGSRVRCTDDGVTGRITWANGVSVKIRWDDGEQVTWRRDSLAGRPIEIIDFMGVLEPQDAAPTEEPAAAEQGPVEQNAAEEPAAQPEVPPETA